MRAQLVDFVEGGRSGAVVKHSLEDRDRFAAQAPVVGSSAHLQLLVKVLRKIFDQ